MIKVKRFLFALFGTGLVAALGACSKSPVPAEKGETSQPRLIAAEYYYDLGPASIDVSRYPKEYQESYRIFAGICGNCHTLARPLNAPYTSEVDWKRYVRRMHVKMEMRGIGPEQVTEKQIVDFLAYDSLIRKIGNKEEFDAEQARLKTLFQETSSAGEEKR